ncbi:DUF4132 domain-containing protein [Salinibacterium sp. NK8237]|uniref:DUF4132 domain-containing protein n=1 Tax=Salinibacterium sp. NK8237 TaxID=2792038 RepID=UPI0018CCAD05|nr:DUF4132 domain-containing protein [Salinibacterium sp. NK8237]MBH0129779.1 DUF4132 domain-containing protein [Salinibacterium sp. NK8237]
MTSADPRSLLADGLADLDAVLRHDILDYVFHGTDKRFPQRLRKKDRAAFSSTAPLKRSGFYENLEAIDRADNEVLVRWGRLLAVAPSEPFYLPELMPRSVWAFLHDALLAFGFHQGVRRFSIPLTTITIERIAALMRYESLSYSEIPRALIATFIGTIDFSIDYRPSMHGAIPGMAEYLVDNPFALDELLPDFRYGAIFEVVRLASTHPPLAEMCAELIATVATHGDVKVRMPALAVLRGLPVSQQLAALEPLLDSSEASHREKVISAIEHVPDIPAAIDVLERALARNTKGSEEIDRAIQRLAIYELNGAPEHIEVPPMVPLPAHPLDGDAVESMRTALIEHRAQQSRRIQSEIKKRDTFLKKYPGNPYPNTVKMLENFVAETDAALKSLPEIVNYLSGSGDLSERRLLLPLSAVSYQLAGFTPFNWVRQSGVEHWGRGASDTDQEVDARSIVDMMMRVGFTAAESHDAVFRAALTNLDTSPTLLPAQLVGFMAENPHQFDVILGIEFGEIDRHWGSNDLRADVLPILEASPQLAARYLPVVTELAIGTAKSNRAAAQRVLEKHGLAQRIAEESLRVGNAKIRAAAVLWVESLGGEWAVDALAQQLSREKAPTVRATIIATLERLGSEIDVKLHPAMLQAEATKGLAKALPTSLEWFPFAELPAATYASGDEVPAEVLRWWVILSFRMKDPAGAGLLPTYMGTLSAASAIEVGRFVLTAWLARDATKDDAESMERAFTAAQRYSRIVSALALRDPEIDRETLRFFDIIEEEPPADPALVDSRVFDHFEWMRLRESQKVPTATAHRGILSLCSHVPGAELAEIVRQYMRRKHLKRAQIDALLVVLSLSGDPEPTQLLVATARRYRTAGIQKRAGELVDAIAEARGWSTDELADRMIPTAGLDSSRTFALDYGPRSFVARFGTSLKLSLETAEGELIKALPAPHKADESAAAAKTHWATNKKELTAVVTTQRRRLYDAMCLRREWTGAEWRERLLEHPIMGVLVAALVWHVDGITVRPDLDGTLRTVDGSPVEVTPDARVSVAHPTTLDTSAIEAWRANAAPLGLGFDQFGATPIAITGTESRRDNLDGTESESFRLRSRAKAREWNRGETGDDVSFFEYVKRFDTVGLEGVLSFSGSSLPETNIPIELGALTIRRITPRGSGGAAQFSELPPALLAELVADYEFFGAA